MNDADTLFRRGAIAGSMGTMIAIGALLAVYGPVIPALRESFGVGGVSASLGLALQSAGAVLGVLTAPALLRRSGNRISLATSVGLVICGSAVVALSPWWPTTLAGATIAGIGVGGCDLLITQLLMVGTGAKGPTLVNLAHACFGVGTVLAPVLIALVDASHFRIVFALIALTATASFLPLRDLSPSPTPLELISSRPGRSADEHPYRGGGMILAGFVVLYAAHFAVQSGIGSWEPTLLTQAGYSASNAALATSGFWFAMVIGRFAAAILLRRFSVAALVVTSCIGMTAAAAVALHTPAIAVAYALAGFFIGPIFPNGLTWLAMTGHAHGNRFAYVVASSMVGMAVAPLTLGIIDQNRGPHGVPMAVLAFAALGLAASIAILVWSRTPLTITTNQNQQPAVADTNA